MRLYLYVALVMVGVGCFVYFMGKQVGNQRCISRYSVSAVQEQSKIIEIQRGVDEEIIGRTTDDISAILHQKYTIAE
jgi:hypothetical protein